MLGLIVETEKYKNSVLLEKVYNDYATNWVNNPDLILPKGIRGQYSTNTPEKRLSYDAYDKKGNPLTISYDKGPKTTYLWSYDSQHPIAEIKNADYATIVSLLGSSNIDNFAALASPDKTAVDNFIAPLKSALPNAQISSYSFEPLVGKTSQTDAKDLMTYYGYDGLQRLQLIKDQNNHILKSYSYNYATPPPRIYYNTMVNQNFTRICTSGQAGSTVTYTVFPNAHTSTVSQTHADQLALNDIALNGQNYANTNGTCTALPTFSVSYSLPSGRQFLVSISNNDVRYDYTLSDSGTLTGLPEGTYNLSINELTYTGNFDFYFNNVKQNGVYVQYGPFLLSGPQEIYVQEL